MLKEPSDFDDWLIKLKEHNLKYFLEGGQAVNLWALRYIDEIPELNELLPFNSKDCDIWVDYNTLIEIPNILSGELLKSKSPIDGQVGIFRSLEDPEKKMDLLSGVFGINPDSMDQVLSRCYQIADYVVIDPLYLFKGKCHNWIQLPQGGRQDQKHLAMLLLIIPQHFRFLLSVVEDQTTKLTARQLIKEVKFFFSFEKDPTVRQALKKLTVTIKQLLPIDEFRSCKMNTIRSFSESL